MRFWVHIGTPLPAHTSYLFKGVQADFKLRTSIFNIVTVIVWWKYDSAATRLQAAHANEKRAIIAELFMPMMQ